MTKFFLQINKETPFYILFNSERSEVVLTSLDESWNYKFGWQGKVKLTQIKIISNE